MAQNWDIGDRIQQARVIAGMSQRILAEATGIPKSAIGGYETGRGSPRPDRVREIAEAAHVSAEWLATGNGEPRQGGDHLARVEEVVTDHTGYLAEIRDEVARLAETLGPYDEDRRTDRLAELESAVQGLEGKLDDLTAMLFPRGPGRAEGLSAIVEAMDSVEKPGRRVSH